jgi:hypothetical protein
VVLALRLNEDPLVKNVRANQHCPRPAKAQAAGYRSRTFNVTGATRIVQRVICEGGGGRKSCSARGANYIRTHQAAVGISQLGTRAGVAAVASLDERDAMVQGRRRGAAVGAHVSGR